MINSWDEFKKFIESEFNSSREHEKQFKSVLNFRKNKTSIAFLLVYPDNLKWEWWVEKQTYVTFRCLLDMRYNYAISSLYLCKRSEVMKTLKHLCKEMYHTRASIVESGMVFTDDYYELMTAHTYMNGHIMADIFEDNIRVKAWMHPMHIELDLKAFKNNGMPDIYKPFEIEKRSTQDHHGGYTPYWIKPKNIDERIRNYNSEQRDQKAWSYNELHHKESWYIFTNEGFREDILKDDYWKILERKHETIKGRYYYGNNEILDPYLKKIRNLDNSYEVIVAPTSGYLIEELAYNIGFKGTIIFYDHTEHHLKIKKQIISFNPDESELYDIAQLYKPLLDDIRYDYDINCQKYVEYVKENCDIQYLKIDLIKDDLSELLSMFEGKKTFFHFSNIFSYDISMLCNSVENLFANYKKIIKLPITFNGEHPFRFRSPDSE